MKEYRFGTSIGVATINATSLHTALQKLGVMVQSKGYREYQLVEGNLRISLESVLHVKE